MALIRNRYNFKLPYLLYMLPDTSNKAAPYGLYSFQMRVWIMCLGFTTLFGALFSKTWRVHRLFRDYKIKKTVRNLFADMHTGGPVLYGRFP